MDHRGAARGMPRFNRMAFHLSRHAPWLLPLAYRPLAAGVARNPERLLARLARLTAPPDAAAIGRPDFSEPLARSFREAFRGGTRGPVRDVVLYTRPWGFSPAEIAVEVDLWHGEQDVVVPPSVGRAVAAALPRCRARFLPDEGHFSIAANRVREMLETLCRRTARGEQ
jgi:pimeloyl-ACP methyl ester carboxylesterase